MRPDKPVLMSTHGKVSNINARKSLSAPRDVSSLAALLAANDQEPITRARIWGFRDEMPVIDDPDPLRAGDVCVTTTRLPEYGGTVLVQRIFTVLAVLFNQPNVPAQLGIDWSGKNNWSNIALLDEPIELDPPIPFPDLNARFGIRPGQRYNTKWLKCSVDELFEWLSTANVPPVGSIPTLQHPTNPDTTVERATSGTTVARARKDATAFKLAVAGAYGAACAACGLDPGIFQAAHLKDWSKGGPGSWWNGLPMCHNHHAYFDLGWIRVDPGSKNWIAGGSRTLANLGVTQAGIEHLPNQPLLEMLEWKARNPVAGRP